MFNLGTSFPPRTAGEPTSLRLLGRPAPKKAPGTAVQATPPRERERAQQSKKQVIDDVIANIAEVQKRNLRQHWRDKTRRVVEPITLEQTFHRSPAGTFYRAPSHSPWLVRRQMATCLRVFDENAGFYLVKKLVNVISVLPKPKRVTTTRMSL